MFSGATAGFGFLTDVPLGISPITLYDGLESPAQLTERAAAFLEAVGRIASVVGIELRVVVV